ncbi:MAG: hypothetical protein AAGA85_00615 [Bacteroidota bacterium]
MDAYTKGRDIPLGIVSDDSAFYVYYDGDSYWPVGKLHVYKYGLDQNDDKASRLSFDMDMAKTRYLGSINQDNRFLLLFLSRSAGTLNVFEVEGQGISAQYQFTLDKEQARMLNVFDLKPVTNEHFTSLKDGRYQNKLFLNGPSNLFVTIEAKGETNIFQLDLSREELTLTTLTNDISSKSNSSNSNILGSTIYKVIATSDRLQLHIYDLASKQMIKMYDIGPSDRIGLNQGRPIREGRSALFTNQEKTLRGTSVVLKKLTKGDIGIAVNKATDQLIVAEMGSFRPSPTAGAPIAIGPTGSAPFTYGNGPDDPVTSSWRAPMSYYQEESGVTTSFLTFLDPSTAKLSSGEGFRNSVNTIDSFIRKMYPDGGEISTVLRAQDMLYLVVLGPKGSTIELYEFPW